MTSKTIILADISSDYIKRDTAELGRTSKLKNKSGKNFYF